MKKVYILQSDNQPNFMIFSSKKKAEAAWRVEMELLDSEHGSREEIPNEEKFYITEERVF